MDLSLAEHQLNTFLNRRAAAVEEDRPGQAAANAEEDRQRARDARRTHAVRLVNARAWAAFHGGQAMHHHDLAAQAAQKRDEALALVRELEAKHNRGDAA